MIASIAERVVFLYLFSIFNSQILNFKMSLLIVGSLALDTIETPFDKRERVLGGSASYISLSANYFAHGSEIGLVGVVGEDFPKHAWDLFKARGFDTSGVEVVKGGKTFFWAGKY